MAELKKRSARKSKLEVRDDDDFEKTENFVLQLSDEEETLNVLQPDHTVSTTPAILRKILQPPKPKILDHTYALPTVSSTPSSCIQISVKVEVEEFDESIVSNLESDSQYHYLMDVCRKRKKQCNTFHINLTNMFNVAKHMTSENYADKYLSVEINNIWGHVLKEDVKEDPHNELIQKALLAWSQLHSKSPRDSPLFYQCHICNLAWWYLSPFEEHIRTHDHTKLHVYKVQNGTDTFIVASEIISNTAVFIPCDGDCYRCGNPFEFHINRHIGAYSCDRCLDTYLQCYYSLIHQCSRVKMISNPNFIQSFREHKCSICYATFDTKQNLDGHMQLSHLVRSDVVTVFSYKKCLRCHEKYYQFFTHKCGKKSYSLPCQFCFRNFPSKTAVDIHIQMGEANYSCKICYMTLDMRCMEAEHMLTHTNNFHLAYKCAHMECSPNRLFKDEASAKLHKTIIHKQKIDNRRSNFEKVIVPEKCVTSENDLMEVAGTSKGRLFTESTKMTIDDSRECETDWCVSGGVADETVEIEHDTDIIKEKIKPETIVNEDDDDDDSQDGIMDYADMLSKVFKVSNSSRRKSKPRRVAVEKPQMREPDNPQILQSSEPQIHQPIMSQLVPIKPKIQQSLKSQTLQNVNPQVNPIKSQIQHSTMAQTLPLEHQIHTPPTFGSVLPPESMKIQITNIKSEPVDLEFENLIDIQDDPIIIKQEPFEACLGISVKDHSYQDYGCRDRGVHQTDFSEMEMQFPEIKSEPMIEMTADDDRESRTFDEFDGKLKRDLNASNLLAIKMEPEDIQELMESNAVNECAEYDKDAIFTTPRDSKIYKTIRYKKSDKIRVNKSNYNSNLISNNAKNIKKLSIFVQDMTESGNSGNKDKKIAPKKKKDKWKKEKKYDEYGVKIKKKYNCSKCGYVATHRLYRMHQMSNCDVPPISNDKGKILCTKCGTYFQTMSTYLIHFKKHGYGILVCPCCNEKFTSVNKMVPHFNRQVKMSFLNCWMINENLETPTKKQHRCQTCREIVLPGEFFAHFEAHMKLSSGESEPEVQEIDLQEEHAGNSKVLQPTILVQALIQLRSSSRLKSCTVCERHFDRRYDVKRHLIEHLLMDALAKKDSLPTKMFRCQICTEEFPRMEVYKFHMREHGSLPVYRCELCNKTFSDSSNFAKHKKIHNMRVLICDTCGKKFNWKSSLIKHVMMHMTSDPIQCKSCDRQFFVQSLYKKHVKSAHRVNKFQFRCILCDIDFSSLKSKWDHDWFVHQVRKHKADCPVCNKGFRKYHDVRIHAKNEHGMQLSYINMKMN